MYNFEDEVKRSTVSFDSPEEKECPICIFSLKILEKLNSEEGLNYK